MLGRGLRSQLSYAQRWTRTKKRLAVVLALATGGALAVAAIAMGAASSTVTLSVAPIDLPTNTFQDARLNFHTRTHYTNAGNANPGGATRRIQLYFDDDIRFRTDAAEPKCNSADISGTMTMAEAYEACGTALVSGIPSDVQFKNGFSTVPGCVLVFNGEGAASEILLFTRYATMGAMTCTNPTTNTTGCCNALLTGDLKANTGVTGANPGDFTDPDNCSKPAARGCQIDINRIPTTAPFPLAHLNPTIDHFSFIAARCHDTGEQSALRLDLRTKFTYNDNTTETRKAAAECT
jgi:hypothetical protein